MKNCLNRLRLSGHRCYRLRIYHVTQDTINFRDPEVNFDLTVKTSVQKEPNKEMANDYIGQIHNLPFLNRVLIRISCVIIKC